MPNPFAPIRPRNGQVTFPKGTPLRSTNPQKNGTYLATRKQTVRITDTLSAVEVTLGRYRPDGTFNPFLRIKDIDHVAQSLGMADPWSDEAATYEVLLKSDACRTENDGRVLLTTNPAKVCWAGSGGYWVEAPVSACTPVE